MSLIKSEDYSFVQAVSKLVYCNPFLNERIDLEREALGNEFVEMDAAWNIRADLEGYHPNVIKIVEKGETLAKGLRERLASGKGVKDKELTLYEDLVLFILYHRYSMRLDDTVKRMTESASGAEKIGYYDSFLRDAEKYLSIPEVRLPRSYDATHIFALFFQIRRAFHHIFNYILGGSEPIIRLRAAVWQSVFTHDLRRYSLSLYKKMGDISTLVTGPSGTGKELVAMAISHSRYIPFDPSQRRFTEDFTGTFHPLNISALSPTLIESELFGHKKGAFTGADQDRQGWLEVCGPNGSVFLDEVGEVEASIQVKLLRVLQTRGFSRLGDTKVRKFDGKIIAATNRDLTKEMREGRIREDFYYRLCADIITTPSLHEQISKSPEELVTLVKYITKRLIGEEADDLAKEVMGWIEKKLGYDYGWPGNIRELEQCVKNILVRKEYHPAGIVSKSEEEMLLNDIFQGCLTADELINRYCTLVYSKTRNYEETARRLKLDRRTVKKRVVDELSNYQKIK